MIRLARGLVLTACALPLLHGEARADARDDSRAAFLQGVTEAHLQHYTAARDAFLRAYQLFPHPSILLNLGIARMRTGEYIAAEEDLVHFLSDDGGASADDITNARSALAVVRRHLGTVRIRVRPAGARATLDGAPVPLVPDAFAEVRAVVGPAELRVQADGLPPLTKQLVVDRDRPVLADIDVAQPGAPIGVVEPPPLPEAPTPSNSSPRRSTRWLGVGLVTGGVVTAGVGALAGIEAITLAHDFNTPGTSQYQNPSVQSRGEVWRTSADVLFASALIAGGVGIYFLVRPPHPGGAGLRAQVGLRGASLEGEF